MIVKLIKAVFTVVLILFGINILNSFLDNEPDDIPSGASKILELNCKHNPNALYVDTFTLLDDMSVTRTSTNRASQDKNYTYLKKGDEFILIGDQTRTDINGNTTVRPDTELFVIAKDSKTDLYNIFYRSDYETDPTRFYVCVRTI